MEQLYIGIDMGGTKCAVVAGHADGKILRRIAFPSGKDAHPDEFLPRFYEAIDALLREYNGGAAPAAVGVSCGGPLDTRRGVIQAPPNLPLWDEVPICALLSERYGCPAYLQNDANACAIAEWRFGAGRGTRNMVFLTFGTGLGAGLILDGRLYEGTNGMAGEAGHLRLAADGPEGYGKRGSFEGFCSGGGLRAQPAAAAAAAAAACGRRGRGVLARAARGGGRDGKGHLHGRAGGRRDGAGHRGGKRDVSWHGLVHPHRSVQPGTDCHRQHFCKGGGAVPAGHGGGDCPGSAGAERGGMPCCSRAVGRFHRRRGGPYYRD